MTEGAGFARSGDTEASLSGLASGSPEQVYLSLVSAYQTAILNYVYRLVGDRDLAEDLTQETFIRAYRALDRLDLDADAEARRRAWLYRIAHNAATDHLRRKGRLAWVSLDKLRSVGRGAPTQSSAEPGPERAMMTADPVHRALDKLTNEQKEILILFNVSGMEAAEVGQVLGISTEAARKRRQRARDAFIAAYEGATDDAP